MTRDGVMVDFLGLKGDYACTLPWDSPEAQELWDSGYLARKAQAPEPSAAIPKFSSVSADPHPEDFCGKCKRLNVVWFAPSPLWNKAVRSKGEPEILCPVCFVQLAEAAGIHAVWQLSPSRTSEDFEQTATELVDWIGKHPRWSRESMIRTIADAFQECANMKAIEAAKQIVHDVLSVPPTESPSRECPCKGTGDDWAYDCADCFGTGLLPFVHYAADATGRPCCIEPDPVASKDSSKITCPHCLNVIHQRQNMDMGDWLK